MICTWLLPGHLRVCVGDSSHHNEEIVEKTLNVPFNAVIIIIITTTTTTTIIITSGVKFKALIYWESSAIKHVM